jgi:hypothetical protein
MKRSKWILLAINLLLIVAVLIICVCYQTNGYSHTLKWLGSCIAALLGLINLIYAFVCAKAGKAFYVCNTLGLLMACLGDALIDGRFIWGAAAFAAGHLCFFVSFCCVARVRVLDGILSVAAFFACLYLLLFAPFISFDPPALRGACLVYALIISAMLGKSVGNLLRAPSATTVVLALAGALFFFSDLMLVLGWFSSIEGPLPTLCLSTYYPSLCLLALGAWCKAVSPE